jgi:hypothetical protein
MLISELQEGKLILRIFQFPLPLKFTINLVLCT